MADDEKAVEARKLKKVYEICRYCRGTKKIHLPLGDAPCAYCAETGVKHTGYIEE